jgi:chemotaxis protein methyltransferase CheR
MVSLSPPLFALLSGLVEERIGLHYETADAQIFSDKVASRMEEAGFESPIDYYYLLRYDDPAGAEMDALTDALVVGETYLFRELEPLKAAIEHVVAPAVEKAGRARIWSAGCATGEEPVTLAMLAEHAKLLERCEIVATDVSLRSLARARSGTYGARSLRALDAPRVDALVSELAAQWLVRDATTGNHQASSHLLRQIDFRRVNLRDERAVAALGSFDLVVCRNVLIYFRDALVQDVANSLAGALAPGGRLLVGASESLLRFGTVLVCEEKGGVFFYTRPS